MSWERNPKIGAVEELSFCLREKPNPRPKASARRNTMLTMEIIIFFLLESGRFGRGCIGRGWLFSVSKLNDLGFIYDVVMLR